MNIMKLITDQMTIVKNVNVTLVNVITMILTSLMITTATHVTYVLEGLSGE